MITLPCPLCKNSVEVESSPGPDHVDCPRCGGLIKVLPIAEHADGSPALLNSRAKPRVPAAALTGLAGLVGGLVVGLGIGCLIGRYLLASGPVSARTDTGESVRPADRAGSVAVVGGVPSGPAVDTAKTVLPAPVTPAAQHPLRPLWKTQPTGYVKVNPVLVPKPQRSVIDRLEKCETLQLAADSEENALRRQELQNEAAREWVEVSVAVSREIETNGLQGWVGNVGLFSNTGNTGLFLTFGPYCSVSADFGGMTEQVRTVVRGLKYGDAVRVTTAKNLYRPTFGMNRPRISVKLVSPADLVSVEILPR